MNSKLENSLVVVVGILMAIGIFLFAVAVAGAVALVLNVIPWALWSPV